MLRGGALVLACLLLSLACAAAAAEEYKFRTYLMDLSISAEGDIHENITALVWNWGTRPLERVSFQLGIDPRNFQARDAAGPLPWRLVRTEEGWSALVNLTSPLLPTEKRAVTLVFDTDRLVRRVNETSIFSLRLRPRRAIDEFSLRVRLPPGHLLPAELDGSGQGMSIIYPEGNIETDGRDLIVSWSRQDLGLASNLEFSVTFEEPGTRCRPETPARSSLGTIALVFLLGFASGVVAMRLVGPAPEKSDLGLAELLPSLDDEESAVVRAIARAGGAIMQSALCHELDCSKSKISRTLSALEGRGIVQREHIGKVNRIILVRVR